MVTYLTTGTVDPTGQGAANAAALVVAPQPQNYIGQTAKDMIATTLSGLGLSWQSAEGELPEGDFSPPEIPRQTTSSYILQMLNEGGAKVCRAGLLCVRKGTQNLAATARAIRYQDFATVDGSVIWSAQDVTWTPAGSNMPQQLTFMGKGQLMLRYGTVPQGWPVQYWTKIDETGIRIADTPSTDGLVGLSGPAVPPPLQSQTDYPGWLSPDLERLLVTYAKRQMCLKSAALAPRFAGFDAEWEKGISEIQAQSKAENPEMWAFVYGGSL